MLKEFNVFFFSPLSFPTFSQKQNRRFCCLYMLSVCFYMIRALDCWKFNQKNKKKMETEDKEVEEALMVAGNALHSAPASLQELLPLLDVTPPLFTSLTLYFASFISCEIQMGVPVLLAFWASCEFWARRMSWGHSNFYLYMSLFLFYFCIFLFFINMLMESYISLQFLLFYFF